MALFSQISVRLLGLLALTAMMSLTKGVGVDGPFWRDLTGLAFDDRELTLVLAIPLIVIATVFLIPTTSGLLFTNDRGFGGSVSSLIRLVFVLCAVGIGAVQVSHEPLITDTASRFIVIISICCTAFLIFFKPKPAERVRNRISEYGLDDERPMPEAATTYRILETGGESNAAASMEERRQRLTREANFAALPRHVREGYTRLSPFRTFLCCLVLAPLVAVIGLGAYGMISASFLPSTEVLVTAQTLTGPFVAYCALAGVIVARIGPRFMSRRGKPRNRIVMGTLFVVALAVAGRMFFASAVTGGAPDLHALRVGGPPATAAVLVVARGADSAWACGRWADIRVGQNAPLHRLCGLDTELADTIVSGERLFLSGVATIYGLRYHKISR